MPTCRNILIYDCDNKKEKFNIKNINNLNIRKIIWSDNSNRILFLDKKYIYISNIKKNIFLLSKKVINVQWYKKNYNKFILTNNSEIEFWNLEYSLIKPYQSKKMNNIKHIIISNISSDIFIVTNNHLIVLDIKNFNFHFKIEINAKIFNISSYNNSTSLCCLCEDETVKFWKIFQEKKKKEKYNYKNYLTIR